MKFFWFILFIFFHLGASGQLSREIWTGIGVKTKINSRTELAVDLNTRSYSYDFQLFYPELTLKYKLYKWLKPSIEYRLLDQKNKYGNFSFSNRLNFNLNFEKEINKRLSMGLRIRYQTTFTSIRIQSDYSPDFDPSIRAKPSFAFAPKKSKLNYNAAVEFFYNPQKIKLGNQFTKIRSSIGTEINLKGPNTLNIKYLYGFNINDNKNKSQHILSIAYTFEWKKKIVDK